jgi:hypothetical protein
MPENVVMLDIGVIFTVIGSAIGTIALVYQIMKSFKDDLHKRMDAQDEKIFQLATGKTLKEAMLEAKRKSDAQTN